MDNRKRHFDDYAKSLGFDPLIAENWYHFSSQDIKKYKVYFNNIKRIYKYEILIHVYVVGSLVACLLQFISPQGTTGYLQGYRARHHKIQNS